jgi:hypothetical protein
VISNWFAWAAAGRYRCGVIGAIDPASAWWDVYPEPLPCASALLGRMALPAARAITANAFAVKRIRPPFAC